MWSDRYNYYNIQSDKHLTQKVTIEEATNAILETNCFVQENHQSFINAENFPWTTITIVKTDDENFHATDSFISEINLIAIVCSKENEIEQPIYKTTFLNIADQLNWKLFLEADDEGNEDIEIK